MNDLESILADNRAAVERLIAAAEGSADAWTEPRAPRKWSPAQIVEHVAMSLEEGGNVVAGRPAKLPSLPFFLRPLAALMFKRVLRKGGFPNVKTNKAMDPPRGPADPGAGRERLLGATAVFEAECRARAAMGRDAVSHTFGRVKVEEYARFVALHTRHHLAQMPPS